MVALAVDFGWHHVGDWSTLYVMMERDEEGNSFVGKRVTLDVHNSLIFALGTRIAVIGVVDLVVVHTDALLKMPRGEAQAVT